MRDQSPISDADQEFLDGLLEQVIERLEQDQPLSVDAMLDGHVHLRARAEGVIRLAREVAVGRSAVLPKVRGYSILAEIGQGGMGTVYLARQERVAGRLVALKVLPAAAALSTRARERFVREAEAIARLHHPHVITIFDVVHSGGVLAYAMEWIEGASLADAIEEKATQRRGDEATKDEQGDKSPPSLRGSVASSPSIHDICHIGISIARALAAVHAAGLLHRDVKPSNILLRRDGSAVLTDFGLVREADSTVTQPGHFAGTPAYSAPEQLRGEIERIDARSDIYSLGVTLYHALARRLPFEKAAKDGAVAAIPPTAMLRLIENGAITPLRGVNPQIPRDLETIISTSMDPDPARRCQTADDLADDLERLLTLRPIKARPTGLVTRTYKLARRNRRSLAAAVLGAIAALALGTAAVIYVFFVPGWTAAHVREARLILLEPGQANSIVSSLYWGRYARLDAGAWDARLRDYDRALRKYDAALRLAPFNESIRRERDVVVRAKQSAGGASRPLGPTTMGVPDEPGGPTTDSPYADPRSTGLFAFLTQDYNAALTAWTAYDKMRNPLQAPDPLVDAALGILYLFDEKAPLAYPRLQKAVEAFPNVGFLMEYLADAAAKCGDGARARHWLEESKRMPRRDLLGAAERINAGILAAEGRTDDAIAAYRKMFPFGPPEFELARLLEREHRWADAVTEYLALVEKFAESDRVHPAFQACADRWWNSLTLSHRRREIQSVLNADDPHATLLFRILKRLASLRTPGPGCRPTPLGLYAQAPWPHRCVGVCFLLPFSANPEDFFSPSLQSLSLDELAERLEVENMSLWSRIYSYPRILKELQFAALRWPALRSVSCLANSAFVAFDEACQRRTRLSHLAAMSAATLALGALASQPANGQCTTPPCFQGLGDLPGAEASSYANAVSADGSTVVGQSSSASSVDDGVFEYEPFRWRIDTGMVGLGDLPGNEFGGEALGVSGDGSMVVGRSRSANSSEGDDQEAFLWTQPGGMTALGDRPNGPFRSAACAISDDGTIVTGWSSGDEDNRLSYWTNGAGWICVDSSSPFPSSGEGISPNGLWHVGSRHYGGGTYEACRWSQSTGFELLGQPLGTTNYSDVQGVSNQGEIVGAYRIASGLVAFRWSANGSVVGLGDFAEGPFESSSRAITANGEFIVGYGTTALGREAALWDAALTMYRVADVLAQHGVQVPVGWLLTSAQDITVNGNVVTICGNGVNPLGYPDAWIARYTLTPACNPADVLQSPSAATVPFGGTVQFSVVAGGTGPLTYQWRKGGVNLVDGPVGCGGTISGATTDTLVLNTVTFVEGGNYDCVVTNACGNDTGAVAALTINPPPAAADVNHDGQVNGSDIQALIAALLAP